MPTWRATQHSGSGKQRSAGIEPNPRSLCADCPFGFSRHLEDTDGTKLQVDVVGLDLTALIDTRQVVE